MVSGSRSLSWTSPHVVFQSHICKVSSLRTCLLPLSSTCFYIQVCVCVSLTKVILAEHFLICSSTFPHPHYACVCACVCVCVCCVQLVNHLHPSGLEQITFSQVFLFGISNAWRPARCTSFHIINTNCTIREARLPNATNTQTNSLQHVEQTFNLQITLTYNRFERSRNRTNNTHNTTGFEQHAQTYE